LAPSRHLEEKQVTTDVHRSTRIKETKIRKRYTNGTALEKLIAIPRSLPAGRQAERRGIPVRVLSEEQIL
jgi:hypothetical protein